jgi:hypothetical protein
VKIKLFALMILGLMATNAKATTFNYGFEGVSGPSQFANTNPTPFIEEYATFNNGVVLQNPSDFPIFDSSFKSIANTNVYGSSDFGTGFSNLINISISKNYIADLISFDLFNGMTVREKYTVTAYGADHNLLSSISSGNLDGNFTADNKTGLVGGASFKTITLDNTLGNIYYIDIISDQTSHSSSAKNWDFLIDNVKFDGVEIAGSVPEPDTYAMILAGLGLMGFVVRRRKAL